MPKSFNCKCPERQKPVHLRNWSVLQYKCNHSTFNGYHFTPSDWSSLCCNSCNAIGRTKAKYVDDLYFRRVPPAPAPTPPAPPKTINGIKLGSTVKVQTHGTQDFKIGTVTNIDNLLAIEVTNSEGATRHTYKSLTVLTN